MGKNLNDISELLSIESKFLVEKIAVFSLGALLHFFSESIGPVVDNFAKVVHAQKDFARLVCDLDFAHIIIIHGNIDIVVDAGVRRSQVKPVLIEIIAFAEEGPDDWVSVRSGNGRGGIGGHTGGLCCGWCGSATCCHRP